MARWKEHMRRLQHHSQAAPDGTAAVTISYTLEMGADKCGVGVGKRGWEWWAGGDRDRWGLQHHPGCQVIVLFMVLNVREAGRKVWGECGRNEECGVIEKGRVGAGLFLVHLQQQACPCPHAQSHRVPHTVHTLSTFCRWK